MPEIQKTERISGATPTTAAGTGVALPAPEQSPSVALPSSPFDRALAFVFRSEGGLNTDPLDPGNRGGGRTMWGITRDTFTRWRTKQAKPGEDVSLDMSTLTREEAAEIYRKEYWEAGSCNIMPANLATVHLDTCVLIGVRNANRILQQALNKNGERLQVDGLILGKTTAAIARADERPVITDYLDLRLEHHETVPSQRVRDRFLRGWRNRIDALKREIGLDGEE